MTFSFVEGSEGVLVKFDQRFGLDETDCVGRMVAAASPDAPVAFDFSAVRVFEDAAIPRLAIVVKTLGQRLSVRGLTLHQRRILRYFGCDAPWTTNASEPRA